MKSLSPSTVVILAMWLIGSCSKNESLPSPIAPRPYIAWEDKGDSDTARYFYNDQLLGTGDEGFHKLQGILAQLPSGTNINIFVPFNEHYVQSNDANLAIPIYRKTKLKERFEDILLRKNFMLRTWLPEGAQKFKNEVPGIAFGSGSMHADR